MSRKLIAKLIALCVGLFCIFIAYNSNLNKTYSKKFDTEYMILDNVHKYIKVVHFTGVGKTIHESNANFIKEHWNE